MIFYRIGLKNMSDLKLNKEIFDIHMIKKAIIAYRNLADISVKDTEDYYEVAFIRCKYGKEKTVAEFENYVIDLMNIKE